MQRLVSVSQPVLAAPQLRKSFSSGIQRLQQRSQKQTNLHHWFQRNNSVVQVRAASSAVAPQQDSVDTKNHGRDIALPSGWSLVDYRFVKEYDSHIYRLRHEATGAELMSVENSDENKTFGAVYRTPVSDSTGIPHILEHSVLCGSKKYPIKDPFIELAKSSLNTFLNAFTYPDRTCYPVASANLKDFYNCVDVYLDAVFNPKCVSDPYVFKQEGWHIEAEGEGSDQNLIYKGVVFNEMKGNFSQPDYLVYKTTLQNLFPDNSYVHNDGGDPTYIPDLTFEQFQKFYNDYYHPSNARFWFYGDDDRHERFRIMDSYLNEYQRRQIDSTVRKQPLFTEPKKVEGVFPAGEKEKDSAKNYESVNWVLTDEPMDVELDLKLSFLNYLLTGTYASPLVFALNESGLGEAITGGGMDDYLRQPMFGIGLKGVKEENIGKVEELILSELKRLSEVGFTASAIEAATNSIEFSLRENNTGSFPRGLSLMLRAMNGWIYDQDPLENIRWSDGLDKIKKDLATEKGNEMFKELIKTYFLENNHRVTVVMRPDFKLSDQMVEDEKMRLKNLGLSEEQLKKVMQEAETLKKIQETPDTPEDIQKIPALTLADIPKSIVPVPTKISQNGDQTILTHDLFTNNIVYLTMGVDMTGVPQNLLPLLPLFCRSLTNMSTEKESFIELTERIDRKTGGVSVSPLVSSRRGETEPVALLTVGGKCMGDKVEEMTDIFLDVLLTAKFDDEERFKQMVLESKQSMESSIIGSGQSYAARRLGAQYSIAGGIAEQTGGYSYYLYLKELEKRLEGGDWKGIQKELFEIRNAIFSSKKIIVNVTAEQETTDAAKGQIERLINGVTQFGAEHQYAKQDWSSVILPKKNEALVVPTQVNYVAKALNLYKDTNYQLHGSSYVADKHLGTTHLWDQVRLIGGAYGGFCSFDIHSGIFGFGSYRDPNLLSTLQAYDASADFLRKELDKQDLERSIIGTIGDVDQYQLPDAKGNSQFMRYLLGVSDEERQKRRDEILSTNHNNFVQFANVLDEFKSDKARHAAVVSLSSLEAAQKEKPDLFDEVIQVL